MQTPPERREKLLDEFERSGLTDAKFAQLFGVTYQTLASWAAQRRKRRKLPQASVKPLDSVRWLEIVVSEARTPTPNLATLVKLRLPNGACLEVQAAPLLPVPMPQPRVRPHAPSGQAPCHPRSVRGDRTGQQIEAPATRTRSARIGLAPQAAEARLRAIRVRPLPHRRVPSPAAGSTMATGCHRPPRPKISMNCL